MDWPAPIHMNAAMTPSQSRFTVPADEPAPSLKMIISGSASRPMASTRPAQAAAIVPVPGRPVSFQTPARSIRPPSSGSPGSRLKTPTSRLATISWSVSTRAMPVGWTTSMASQPRPARPRDSSGPAPETRNSLARRLRLLLDLGEAAQRVQQDPADRQAEGAGHHAVAELVDQHGDVQQQHERGGHQVARGLAGHLALQAVGVEQDEQARDQEPVRRDVDRDAERPGDDQPRARRGGRPAGG